eukprot:11375838-Alexandrium_andersonii.AAC.1
MQARVRGQAVTVLRGAMTRKASTCEVSWVLAWAHAASEHARSSQSRARAYIGGDARGADSQLM